MLLLFFFSIQRFTPYRDTSTAIIRCDYDDYQNQFPYLRPYQSQVLTFLITDIWVIPQLFQNKMSRVHFRLNMGVYIFSNHSYLITPETNTHPVAPSQVSLHWPSFNKAMCHKNNLKLVTPCLHLWSMWWIIHLWHVIFSHVFSFKWILNFI